jgi:hypothetical protein
VGPAVQALLSTGAPAFVDDGTLLTLHPGAVIAWDVATGERRCALTDRGLAMVRIAVGLGGTDIAMSSSSLANPEIGNRLWVIASLADCRVAGRFLAWPDEPIGAVRRGDRTYLASNDRVRIIDADHHAVLGLGRSARRFAVSRDGSRLLFAMDQGEVLVWNIDTERLTTLPARAAGELATVWDDGAAILALTATATLVSWPMPDATTGTMLSARPLTPIERRWEDAIVEAGVGDRTRALELLAPFEGGAAGVGYRAPAAYVRAILTEEDAARFRTRTRDEGITFDDAGVLEIARSFADYQLTVWGADILLYHFRDRGEGLDGGAEAGCELARQLGEIDETELQDLMARRLAELYPDHSEVRALLAEMDDSEDD